VRDLIGAGAPATASASMPDLRGVRLLHIQHEPSLIHDSDVHRVTQEAREQRIAVVVTEHAVTASPPAWEDQVSALVAPSRAGADLLRRRCPGQRVEHIPLGCPTWFPPRKPTRGRVIGAFGFLEPHKGFGRVLELVRKLGNVRLLICSHSKREAAVWEFAAAIDGLPVRWLRDFRRADEVARLLAADADILVYWYDESPVLSASAAVRVGLATGVPVLTSPTAWFSDLRDVTYQPATLEDGVSRLLDDTSLRNTLIGAARDYCHEHRWRVVARRHEDLWSSIDRRPSPVTLV
jgi:glycosyltransferase involved in cell wall biosynthesis